MPEDGYARTPASGHPRMPEDGYARTPASGHPRTPARGCAPTDARERLRAGRAGGPTAMATTTTTAAATTTATTARVGVGVATGAMRTAESAWAQAVVRFPRGAGPS
ncbi:hypothetical protein D7294_03440 [Streptomyces hoynatensis]|uniref:Uncharacterized protein n=1 Tax=Streptomyces hoynatensis TaxID=1141874 RepID=A0A3A9ZB87_9ACTN|nr:hypothetical protein D7294_03440 [Streptomyces hoynatensis]